ncbi:hypothetical protein Y032_0007g3414 [Ancylostoma ceylanicum]|uniref:Uncharacterized protein n=1 Tax=Ancylostoma ceylanicum TaxID=53326 RepID=A0A016VMX1_9BILA|nr:hypothetical protein Y032_0007g3414 [Ancylostoma ceylanicum]
MPERPSEVLAGECKIGQGWIVWQCGPCLLLPVKTNRQSHMRVIFVNVHSDTLMSLFSIFSIKKLMLLITSRISNFGGAFTAPKLRWSLSW